MSKPLSEVPAGDVKAVTVTGAHRMQFPRRKVDTAGQKAGSLPTVTQSHPDNSRPAATGIDGQEGVDMDKDCKVQ